MSTLHSKGGLRRSLLALGAFALVSMSLAAPALADHGPRRGAYRHGGHRHWFPPLPAVVVGLPLPPVVVVAAPGSRGYGYGYDGYDRRDRAYDRGYEDGYDDRDREEWRRDHYRRHHDCDHRHY